MLTWCEGLLVVVDVFKKPLAFFSEYFCSCSSHRVTGRTSLDCGKKEIQRVSKKINQIVFRVEKFHAGHGKNITN